jgi:hypothetical protein
MMDDGLTQNVGGMIMSYEPIYPTAPVMVLDSGIRVPLELKFVERKPNGWFIFRPVIEGDILKLMPMPHSVDAEFWPPSACLIFPQFPERGLTEEWCIRLLKNSPVLRGMESDGQRWQK